MIQLLLTAWLIASGIAFLFIFSSLVVSSHARNPGEEQPVQRRYASRPSKRNPRASRSPGRQAGI
ncbi:MAG TPA: hypothetical protein VIV15_08885 [Anaerolineales bacterium]